MGDKRSIFARIAEARAAGAASPPQDSKARERWPTIFEFLTRTEASPDLLKDLASLTIKMGLAEWTIDLSDPGFAVSCSAAAGTLDGLFDALETALTGPNPPIRPWKGETGATRKKKRVDKE